MKKVLSVLLMLVIALTTFSAASADSPAPGGPFNSAFRVQNLETSNAACSFIFYDENGAAQFTSQSYTVTPGDAMSIYVPNLGGVAQGSYSAVVTCDKKVASVSNFSDANSGASFSGISDPGTTWYAPAVYDNYYNYYSTIIVQNATASAVDVTVELFAPGSSTAVKTYTKSGLAGYSSVSFEQEGATELVNNQYYSAKITGTGDIAPIVNIYGRGAALDQLYSYNPFKSGSTTAYAPNIMNNYYGFNTAITVQNMGSADADVDVVYSNGYTHSETIAPGASKEFYTPNEGANVPAGKTVYAATIQSTQEVAVLVNQSDASVNRAASYNGVSNGTTEVRAPIVYRHYYDYNTAVICQNVGTAAATIQITYYSQSAGLNGVSTTSEMVDPGGVAYFYQWVDPILGAAPLNWEGSAKMTSAQPIACIVNENQMDNGTQTMVMDQLYSYNGLQP